MAEEINENEEEVKVANNDNKGQEIELAAAPNIYVDLQKKAVEDESSSEDVVVDIDVNDPPPESPRHSD